MHVNSNNYLLVKWQRHLSDQSIFCFLFLFQFSFPFEYKEVSCARVETAKDFEENLLIDIKPVILVKEKSNQKKKEKRKKKKEKRKKKKEKRKKKKEKRKKKKEKKKRRRKEEEKKKDW